MHPKAAHSNSEIKHKRLTEQETDGAGSNKSIAQQDQITNSTRDTREGSQLEQRLRRGTRTHFYTLLFASS